MVISSGSFSVIIVTKDRCQSVLRTIKSVLSEWEAYIKSDRQSVLELVVIDNNSADNTRDVLNSYFTLHRGIAGVCSMRIHTVESNVGVAGGRNIGYSLTTGENVLFIDDDAVFQDDVSTNVFSIIDKSFRGNDRAVILAARVLAPNGELRPEDMPNKYMVAEEGDGSVDSFVGVAHAIKRSRLQQATLYPDCLELYGMEEEYLSWKVIDKGGTILYVPEFVVIHYKEGRGRFAPRKVVVMRARNRIMISILLLPAHYVVSRILLWAGWAVVKNRSLTSGIRVLALALSDVWHHRKDCTKVSRSSIIKMRLYGGHVWY